MNTIVKEAELYHIDKGLILQAGEIIKKGGLVAFPTETVYGLGADALDENASAKIYAAKGRPSDNPLIVHIADTKDLDKIAARVPDKAQILARRFWPGPLTMIFEKTDAVPPGTTGGLSTVAVRMPDHPLALSLIRASGGFVAAPSANTSGRPSPTRACHVAEDMAGKVDMILDGGTTGIGIESTIIDMTGAVPMILRPGFITKAMLEEAVGPVEADPAVMGEMEAGVRPRAPGMKYKHYAPAGQLLIVEGEQKAVTEAINRLSKEKLDQGYKVGIIATDETFGGYSFGEIKSIGTRANEQSISRNLYHVLRAFDDSRAAFIYSESFKEGEMSTAIMNRLLKAAGHQVLKV